MTSRKRVALAMSGGPDSTYLYHYMTDRRSPAADDRKDIVMLHFNHRFRGMDSEVDEDFVKSLARAGGVEIHVGRAGSRSKADQTGVESRARKDRYDFFRRACKDGKIRSLFLAHTADDQVETVLMRLLEGAGISGLKGIPRRADDGIERPLLDTWREDILAYLRRHKIPYRTDKSNSDTRFERNWVRHVLIPLLEKRYGKAVKKRIFTLGERFRELDEFLDVIVRRWMKRNVRSGSDTAGPTFRLRRAPYSKLPSVVRKKIVQILCFEGMKIAPNERLLEAMDTVMVSGKPSARLHLGKGATLSCRYGEAVYRSREAEAAPEARRTIVEKLVARELDGMPTPARLRRLAAAEREAAFDADGISVPFSIRPLRAGDRIRPFGAAGAKKVKELLIDRKVARDERWGRPVVCDANGEIVWIPGVVRSAVAPVTRETRRTIVLGLRRPSAT